MKKLLLGTVFALAAGLSLSGTAHAVPQIGIKIIEDGITVATFPLTAGGGTFTQTYSDALFSSVSVSASGVPTSPDPNFGTITINATSSSTFTGTHTLSLVTTQTGLSGTGFGYLANTFTYNGLSNPGNVTSSVGKNYVDAANGAYAMTTLIASTPDEGGVVTYSSGVILYSPTPAPLFSETEVYNLTFIGQALAQTSTQITGIPEPISLSLFGASLVGLGLARRRKNRAA